jgi:hypothetical protein
MEELSLVGSGEVGVNLNPAIIEHVTSLGDNFLTLFDPDNSSVVFKGVIDQ